LRVQLVCPLASASLRAEPPPQTAELGSHTWTLTHPGPAVALHGKLQ
jgi:hypothetical protein